jgi:hypothetical protein
MIKEVGLTVAVVAGAPFLVGAFGISPPPDGLWWAPYVITGLFGLAAAAVKLVGERRSKRRDDDEDDETNDAAEERQKEKK